VNITQVRVEYGRTVSDGEYGSERATFELSSSVAEGEDFGEVADRLAEKATALVRARLKQSTSEKVLQAVETKEETEARWDREREAARERAARPRAEPVLVDEEDEPDVSVSLPGSLPSWRQIRLVKDALYGPDVDAVLVLPRAADYVNIHPNTLQLYQLPVVWGIR
jgi:hypothetical protein